MPPKSRKPETRAAMVKAGCELLLEGGVEVVAKGLTLESVQQRAGVPRSTAYEAWSDQPANETPQQVLHREVLAAVATGRIGRSEIEATSAALRTPEATEIINSGDREMATRLVLWQAALATIETRQKSKAWLISIAAYGAAASTATNDVDDKLLRALTATRTEWLQVVIDEIYRPFGAILGLRPRDHIVHPSGEPWMSFAHAAAAVADGFTPVYSLDRESVTGLIYQHGTTAHETTLFGLALDAMAEYFLEMVPPETT